jgi:hypothetical protein
MEEGKWRIVHRKVNTFVSISSLLSLTSERVVKVRGLCMLMYGFLASEDKE